MGKRLELLKSAFPLLTRVAALTDRNLQVSTKRKNFTGLSRRRARLHLELTTVEADTPEFLRVLTPASFAGVDGLITVPDAMFWSQRRVIVALAAAARLPEPTQSGSSPTVAALLPTAQASRIISVGRLDMSFVSLREPNRAICLSKEFEKFDFVVNLQTARALGFTIPPSILASADQVIE